ncbi:MAG: hypothetical protein IT270_20575 [Saprospiraceae bacterium]|nr:hypothetical protein [Saprospiraceae bacterium]
MTSLDLIGRVVTDIKIRYQPEAYGLDHAEVILELDHVLLTIVPYGLDSDIGVSQLQDGFESIFSESKYQNVWLVNPLKKTINFVVQEQRQIAQSFWGRLKRLFGIHPGIPKDYRPYGVEYRENPLHNLKNQTIIDLLAYEDSTDKCFIELENGMLFTEIQTAPNGTGNAGLHWFENLQSLKKRYGTKHQRLSEVSPNESE